MNDKRDNVVTVSSWCFQVLTGSVSVCLCAYTHGLDGDRLCHDCSFLSRTLLIGVIDGICEENDKHDKWHSTKCSSLVSCSRYFPRLKAQRKPEHVGLCNRKEVSLSSSRHEVAYGFDRSIYLNRSLSSVGLIAGSQY